LIKAKLSYRYPLTDVIAKARVYDGAKFIETIEMYDDGKQSHDGLAEDGVYTGLIDIKGLNLPKAGRSERYRKIRVDVEFLTTEKTRPAPRARYEAGARYGDLVKDYDSIKVSGQLAYSTQMVFVKPPKPVTPRIVPIGGTLLPRRVRPGDRGSFSLNVTEVRPPSRQIRATLGPGVKVNAVSVKSIREGTNSEIRFDYQISRDAGPGFRNLRIQFGRHLIERRGVIEVRRK
ncbi:MAG: hypothetical protein OEQ28_14990, partial [Acidobacteriota bacterium]|nr:hypothetical protein [Acidobacteriota bacterium]